MLAYYLLVAAYPEVDGGELTDYLQNKRMYTTP